MSANPECATVYPPHIVDYVFPHRERDRLLAERDENTCRKDFIPSELLALGRQLEELERPKAEQRTEPSAGVKFSLAVRP